MKARVIEDAPVLIPNKEHKNFTASKEIVEAESIVDGEPRDIQGLRRGQPFTYKLFYTTDGKIIYIKKIKPMEKTEVTLNADADTTPTKVDMPNQSNLGVRPVVGSLVGAGIAFAWSKHKKFEHKKTLTYTIVGAVAGFVVGKYLQSHNPIKIKASK